MFSLKWWVIVGYATFMIILIVFFDMYLKRKTSEGLRGHREIPKNLMWIFILGLIGVWIVTLYPIIFIFYPNIVSNTFPVPFISSLPLEIPGILLIVVGCILTTVSLIQLGLSARFYLPKQKTKLMTSGVYSFCRNPLYVGAHLSFFGIFLLLPSLIYLVGFCLFLINQHFRILQEEEFLIKSFGAEYENYMRRVGRYLPRIRRT